MISDMFPAERRASALGFYSTGVSIGILFGFLMGGWLNEFFGWRVAFFVVGVPGVLLALVVRYTLREPRRGLSENRDDNPEPVAVKEVVALLWSRRSFRHMAWAGALSAFAGYSVANWSASFIIRSYGMSTGELGTWLALIIGIGGAVGVFGGGLLADKLAAKDTRWYVLLPALAGVISLPFAAGVYLVDNVYASLLLMIIPAIQSNVFLGNTLAVSHSLVGLRMRAMASAILFFIFNLVGLGAGPWSVGLLSDLLAPQFGDESLRYAMLALVPLMVSLSALHFYLSSRHLKRDLAAAPP